MLFSIIIVQTFHYDFSLIFIYFLTNSKDLKILLNILQNLIISIYSLSKLWGGGAKNKTLGLVSTKRNTKFRVLHYKTLGGVKCKK